MPLALAGWELEGRHDGFELVVVASEVEWSVGWVTLGERNDRVPGVGLGNPAIFTDVRPFHRTGAAKGRPVHAYPSFNGVR